MEQEDRRDPNAVFSQIIYYRTGIGTGTSTRTNTKDAIFGRGRLYTLVGLDDPQRELLSELKLTEHVCRD